MIQIRISTNDIRKTIIVDENSTIRQVLENNDINYATTAVLLDGGTINPGQFDQTFKEFNISEKCILSTVVKTNNAL